MNFSYAHANMSCNENGFFEKFYDIEHLILFYLYTLMQEQLPRYGKLAMPRIE